MLQLTVDQQLMQTGGWAPPRTILLDDWKFWSPIGDWRFSVALHTDHSTSIVYKSRSVVVYLESTLGLGWLFVPTNFQLGGGYSLRV